MAAKLFQPPQAGEAVNGPYAACRDHVTKREARDLLERGWAATRAQSGDVESDFLERFRGPRFHSAAWEIYLRSVLLDQGFCLTKTAPEGPDVRITVDGRTVWIEAATVEPGDASKPDSVAPRGDETGRVLFPVEQLLLRLTNTIDQKRKQIARWREKGIVVAGDDVVLAINFGTILDADLHDQEVPAVVQAVFGVGSPAWLVPVGPEAGSGVETILPARGVVEKRNGVTIPMDAFRDPESDWLTGVLYARQLVWNLRWDTRLDLGYVHNPMANPLPRAWMPFRSETYRDGDSVRIETRSEEVWVPRPLSRPSKSGDATRLAERQRLAKMSPRERALLALRLGDAK